MRGKKIENDKLMSIRAKAGPVGVPVGVPCGGVCTDKNKVTHHIRSRETIDRLILQFLAGDDDLQQLTLSCSNQIDTFSTKLK